MPRLRYRSIYFAERHNGDSRMHLIEDLPLSTSDECRDECAALLREQEMTATYNLVTDAIPLRVFLPICVHRVHAVMDQLAGT